MILKGSQMKTRKFNYAPRFYDEKKAEREARKRRLDLEKDTTVEGTKHRISSSFDRRRERGAFLSGAAYRSNARIIAIVFGLLILAYFFVEMGLPRLLRALN